MLKSGNLLHKRGLDDSQSNTTVSNQPVGMYSRDKKRHITSMKKHYISRAALIQNNSANIYVLLLSKVLLFIIIDQVDP